MLRRIEKRLAIHFLLGFAALSIASASAFHSYTDALRESQKVGAVTRAQLELQRVLSLANDAETGRLRFLISGRESDLEPFEQASRAVGTHLQALKGLLQTDAETERVLACLQRLVDEGLAEQRKAIDVRRSGGLEAALPVALTDWGRRGAGPLRATVRELERRQQAAADRLPAERNESESWLTRGGVVAGVVTALVLLLLSVRFVRCELTERERVEQQRMELLADLQSQSRDLQAARIEAETANRAKSEFLASMSHELRTPMNSIMGFTARLIRKLGPTLGERELDALQTVDRNAKHLLDLINDILDLSKIEAGKMEVHAESFDLAQLAREVYSQAAALVDGRPVVLEAELSSVAVEADRRMIKQVLLNLVSNAAKFTDRGSIKVSVGVADDASLGHSARVSVRDTGIGIGPEDRPNLFRQFSQLGSARTRPSRGTGLGLALSERMVRIHGGRIDVDSDLGRGSEFTIVIPLRPRMAPCAIASPATFSVEGAAIDQPRHGLTILCVDDEPDTLKYLKLTFEDAGFNTLLAAGYHEAVSLAASARPDLICLDLSLTDGDGFQVLHSLHENALLASVPVLVISATSQEARALREGARRCLPKPASAEELIDAVRELLVQGSSDVLVVEDEPDSLKYVADSLAEHGMNVATARDGREALAQISRAAPAAIVLDLLMPGMDGFALLERLSVSPDWRRIPVVVLTAKSLTFEEREWLGRCCSTVLAKGKSEAKTLVNAVLTASQRQPTPREEAVPA